MPKKKPRVYVFSISSQTLQLVLTIVAAAIVLAVVTARLQAR